MVLRRLGISRNVFVLGWVSFFNDIASEMIYPLVPLFLTGVIGAPVSIVGVIEGIAESTASVLKAFSGWLSDRVRRRKPFLAGGYLLSAASKGLMALAQSWTVVLAGRFADRFGKGIRTAARDALIAESSEPNAHGRSFGFHRGMDTLGAVIGPLAALALMSASGSNYRLVFALAVIPGLIGVGLLVAFVREHRRDGGHAELPRFTWRGLDSRFKVFLIASMVFAIGNSSDAFLILRAQDLGVSTALTIVLYAAFNLTYSLCSLPAGLVSDRIGPRRVLIAGFGLFAAVYAAFGLIGDGRLLWLLFPAYGVYMALTEGVGKAYIASLVEGPRRGTAYGVYQMATGLCTFGASAIAGVLWQTVGVAAPFVFGAVMAVVAAGVFGVGGRTRGARAEF